MHLIYFDNSKLVLHRRIKFTLYTQYVNVGRLQTLKFIKLLINTPEYNQLTYLLFFGRRTLAFYVRARLNILIRPDVKHQRDCSDVSVIAPPA